MCVIQTKIIRNNNKEINLELEDFYLHITFPYLKANDTSEITKEKKRKENIVALCPIVKNKIFIAD